MEEDCYSVAS